MSCFALCAALVSAFLPLSAVAQGWSSAKAQGSSKPPAADTFRKEALVFESSETTIRMHADGTGERIVHASLRIQSEAAARQFAVLSFAYASASETPTIKLVRVHKPDGTTVDTPAADAIEMPAAVTREAPLYSDLKEKHVPVRSLSSGDTLEYELDTTIDKPQAPGQFWGVDHFTPPATVVVFSEALTLEFPLGQVRAGVESESQACHLRARWSEGLQLERCATASRPQNERSG